MVTVRAAPPVIVLAVRAVVPADTPPLVPVLGAEADADALCDRLLAAGLLGGAAFAAADGGALETVRVTLLVVFETVFVTALFVFETVLVTPATGFAAARCGAKRRETSMLQRPTHND